jgi:hypothetical protein
MIVSAAVSAPAFLLAWGIWGTLLGCCGALVTGQIRVAVTAFLLAAAEDASVAGQPQITAIDPQP